MDSSTDSSNSTSPVSARNRTSRANGTMRVVESSGKASRGISSAAAAARSVSSCTTLIPSRSLDAMTSLSILLTASATLASEGR